MENVHTSRKGEKLRDITAS